MKESDEIRVVIDFEDINRLVRRLKPKKVGVAAPDGLQSAALKVYEYLANLGLEPMLLLDPTYGSCDLQDLQAEVLGLDLVINLGHTINAQPGRKTFLVGVEYLVSESRLNELAKRLSDKLIELGYRKISVFTTSNYLKSLRLFKRSLLANSSGELEIVEDAIGEESYLLPSQVLGCNFSGPWRVKDRVDCLVVFGGSLFHAVGVYISTRKPTLMASPETLQILDVKEEAEKILKKAVLSVYKAANAKKFAVIVGLKRGWPSQMFLTKALELKRELEALGKQVIMVALTEVTRDRLALLKDVDAFIETACPRIPFDIHDLGKPLLSYPQAIVLINLLKGRNISNSLFELPVWV